LLLKLPDAVAGLGGAAFTERRVGWMEAGLEPGVFDVAAGRVVTRCGAFGWSFTEDSSVV
jgi:hypothetical protein